MNYEVNANLQKIIDLDNEMKEYRANSEKDVVRYRERNENKLAALNAYLKNAQEESDRIKRERMAELKLELDCKNRELEELLSRSARRFDDQKERIVEEVFGMLFPQIEAGS